ncbi:preprotein translocase subunit SecE [Halothermothrix orenii]|uniref:Protein translocase subunit SecE n=1 Tax=Halothermothrix orenii (strain H 168 / OCM 544 / DSM 9562) TaxID=373903 RepID=B8D0B0_HALOH|nr:preprotein translocase subunit SecE [Halothermothrix orenii]ACL68864.1 preprotein translocase, SecE subunit [Halothermothrix orenii H 168]
MAGLSFFGKIKKFFRNFKAELKKVNWPRKKELSSYTAVVLVTVVALIIFIGVMDYILTSIITPLIM